MNEALLSARLNATPVQMECKQPEPEEYKRPKQDILREHELTIRFLSVGCVVRVGCKEIPFESIDRAVVEINDYVRDPHRSIERWNKVFNQ